MSAAEDKAIGIYLAQGYTYNDAVRLGGQMAPEIEAENAARVKAAEADKTLREVTSSLLSEFEPYKALANKDLTPQDATSLIALAQSTKLGEAAITQAQKSASAPKEGPSMFMPAQIAEKVKKNPLPFIIGAVVIGWFLFKRRG